MFDTALTSGQPDWILDYSVTDDQFELNWSIFTANTTENGALRGDAFQSNIYGQANDIKDRIIYETDTGGIYYDQDGTGSIERVLFAVISAKLAMTASEFDIV